MAKNADGFDWSEESVFKALETIHPGPERWTLVPHLPDATSMNKRRTVDAMAFSCWQSEGIAVHGYEIKTARSDWLREIQQPEKSLEFSLRCNYWWVAAPADIVKIEEMPSTWGLRVVSRRPDGSYGVRVKKAATYHATPNFDIHFVVALARACWQMSPDRKADEKALAAEYERGYQAGQNLQERRSNNPQLVEERNSLNEAIKKFEEASGILIANWNAGESGRALKALLDMSNDWAGVGSLLKNLESMTKSANELAEIVGYKHEIKDLKLRKKRRG